MPDTAKDDLSTRLGRLPGQLLLALVNGTAILVILAAILAMIATSKVTGLAHSVTSTMTDAVFSRVGEHPSELVRSVGIISKDVRTLTTRLKNAKAEGVADLKPEITRLNERLGSLEDSLERLRGARSDLVDELIARVGGAVGDALQNFATCPRPAASLSALGT